MTDQDEQVPGRGPITWHAGEVGPDDRRALLGHAGATLWFTGLSGSGKSTIAVALERALLERGVLAYRLDGDNLRHGLNAGLGFTDEDRAENVRRTGEVARLIADAGLICLASLISPARAQRDLVRAMHDRVGLAFAEVFVETPLEICETRDPKGLYKKARAGEIRGMTGIDAPYEAPSSPELTLTTADCDPDACVQRCLAWLRAAGVIS